ncbi:uncharacterized protein B0P05DRAFT_542820 [Gilbertella persicaria]|uniref:uncharacterized protein n=1 Tax=Gilbertella persicaria TaxID=101096 RepID=UPI00221FD418|nr:uncharacterized protein B0P05DRAFT_542820 [Gilbertella persicaria]KAI8078170.1 hypothetical protein B0P05DRAFT_542820 [Gilbertella persicaria]
MQTLQQQQVQSNQSQRQYYLDNNEQSVSNFLDNCHLPQYLDIFLQEGFDSVTSLLEITEEDMIFMNVKRGHRRLIQREIATMKGIPPNQPIATNRMGAKYAPDMLPNTPLKMEDTRRPSNRFVSNTNANINGYVNSIPNSSNNFSGYDTLTTGLTSPQSMNSGIGSSTSGNSSGSSLMLRTRFQPSPRLGRSNENGNGSSGSGVSNTTDSSGGILNKSSPLDNNNNVLSNSSSSTNKDDNNNNNDANSPNDRTNSISSNDDDDSIDTNGSAHTATKRKYRRHPKPDRNAPIKPPSAYIMFSNDARAELKDQNLSFAELAKIVGDRWKNLTHIDKQAYERMAMRAKDEYLASLEQYRQTPQYHRYQEYLADFKAKQDAANRMIGRARKRAKPASPGSGSIADSSSNGNSNGNGSSGSGSADAYGDKDTVIRRQHQANSQSDDNSPQHPLAEPRQPQQHPSYSYDIDNVNSLPSRPTQPHPHHPHHHYSHHNKHLPPSSSDSGYASQNQYNSSDKSTPQWNYRSNQIMRGILPVEFIHHNPSHPSGPPPLSPHSNNPQTQQKAYLQDKDIDMDDDEEDEVDDEIEARDKMLPDTVKSTRSAYGSKRRSPRFTKPPMQT